jgi:acyl carrier protein
VSESRSIIREYLLSPSDDPVDPEDLESSMNLLDDGVLDSLRLMRLIQFIGERFSFELQADEVVPENFRTLETIAALVDRKIGAAGVED